jgi:hypothetical protein
MSNPELAFVLMEQNQSDIERDDYYHYAHQINEQHFKDVVAPMESGQMANTDWTPVDDIWAPEVDELPEWKQTSDRITELLSS